MSLNDSIVEDATLEWFGELVYAVGHGPRLAPGGAAAERDCFDKVALVVTKIGISCLVLSGHGERDRWFPSASAVPRSLSAGLGG